MHLSEKQEQRFFDILSPLCKFVNDRLGAFDDDSLTVDPYSLDEEDFAELVLSIWENPELIEEFVEQNPAGLSRMDISAAADFKYSLTRLFFVPAHADGYTHFMADEKLYAVCGISGDLSEIITETPAFVITTLLPFAGNIICSSFLSIVDEDLPVSEVTAIMYEYEHMIANGDWSKLSLNLIKNHEHHQAAEQSVRERSQRAEEIAAKRREDPRSHVPEGMHWGALAGMSDEERKQALAKQDEELFNDDDDDFYYNYKSLEYDINRLPKGVPLPTLQHALQKMRKEKLVGLAKMFEIPKFSSKAKNELVTLLAGTEDLPERLIGTFLLYAGDSELETFNRLLEHGGKLEMQRRDVSLNNRPLDVPPLVSSYNNGDAITTILPEEFIAAYEATNTEQLLQERRAMRRIHDCAMAFTAFYGIVKLKDFVDIFNSYYPDGTIGLDYLFVNIVEQLNMDSLAGVTIWLPQVDDFFESDLFDENYDGDSGMLGECCLIDMSISVPDDEDEDDRFLDFEEFEEYDDDEFDDDKLSEDDFEDFGDDRIDSGEFDEDFCDCGHDHGHSHGHGNSDARRRRAKIAFRNHLRHSQLEAPRKLIPVEDIEDFFILRHCCAIPEVRKLRDFLDIYIPDGQDDYSFADQIIMAMIDLAQHDYQDVEGLFYAMAEAGIDIEDDAYNKEFMVLATDAYGSLPNWALNGHSAKEYVAMRKGAGSKRG